MTRARPRPGDRRRAPLHQRRDECGSGAASLPVVGDGDGDVGTGRIGGPLHEMGDPDRPLLTLRRQRDKQERNVMHPVNAVDKQPDHLVIELTERRQEPALARIRRQPAEPLAQHIGIGGQQRPDHRRGAVLKEELPGQHLARGRTRQRLPDLRRDDRGQARCSLGTIGTSTSAGSSPSAGFCSSGREGVFPAATV